MFQYQPSAFLLPDDTSQHFTIDQAAAQITRDDDSWSLTLGQAYTVTAAFRMSDAAYANNGVSGFHEFSQAQIDAANLSMQSWSDVANITFQRVGTGDTGPEAYSDNAQVLFGDYTTGAPEAAAFTYLPRQGPQAGDVWVNGAQPDNQSPTLWSYGQMTLTHEIGHSIGLEHPGDYDASDSQEPTYQADAAYAEDTYQYSVMSYFSETNTGGNYSEYYPSAPQLDDISAAQRLYGANETTRTGDTVYGFHSNADRPWFIATDASSPLIFSVWDAGGHDTFDFSGYTSGSDINLVAGTFSSVGGLVDNVSIAEGVTIEDAVGGTGSDTITGNASNNVLIGGDGNDLLIGGDGNDTLISGSGDRDYLNGGNGFDVGDYSAEFGHVFEGPQEDGLEKVIGSAYQDRFDLEGSTYQSIYGGGGDDVINYSELASPVAIDGGDGSDTLILIDPTAHGYTVSVADFVSVENLTGGDGNDVLIGNVGANVLFGGAGDNTLVGGGGADTFEGSWQDVASFAGVNGPVQIDLVHQTGIAAGVTVVLDGVGGVIGSSFDDDITVWGRHGSVRGGAGNDVFHMNLWFDSSGLIDGGAGFDTIDFSGATATIVFNMASPDAGVVNVEQIVGSRFTDVLTGDHLANTLVGGGGDDILDGGQGNDRLDGGDGNDTVSYAHAAHGVRVDLTHGTGGGAAAGADVLVSIETVVGSSFDDFLKGSAGINSLSGGVGDDVLSWSGGRDVLDGGDGIDTANFSGYRHAIEATSKDTVIADTTDTLTSIERVVGTDFNDTMTTGANNETLIGGDGRDTFIASGFGGTFIGGSQTDTLTVEAWRLDVDLETGTGMAGQYWRSFKVSSVENVVGGDGFDIITGDDHANGLSGAGGVDSIVGGGGRDRLDGGDGADTLTGGLGADVLTGGSGADHFIFASVHDSDGKGAMDEITDLSDDDLIDLHLIDANTSLAGHQNFVEVTKFDHHAGELVLSYSAGTGVTKLMLDVDGDGKADMTVKLDGDHRDFTHFVL